MTIDQTTPTQPTLGDVLRRLDQRSDLPPARRRDLKSAVSGAAKLMGDRPDRVPLDLQAIGARLARVAPAAVGISVKTLRNIRSGLLAAVRASGLKPEIPAGGKVRLADAWTRLYARLSTRRQKLGLSRLAHHASRHGIAPAEVGEDVFAKFIVEVRETSLSPGVAFLHRQTATIWNETAAALADLGLTPVPVPPTRARARRYPWSDLPPAFRQDVAAYLAWLGGDDIFAADARERRLAPTGVKAFRERLHTAVTAWVAGGGDPALLTSLADLVSVDAVRQILRQRNTVAGGKASSFNGSIATTLIQTAHEWTRTDDGDLAKIKALVARLPRPRPDLTDKNRARLRQFSDVDVLRRFLSLPAMLFAEARKDPHPTRYTLAKAQAAIAIGLGTSLPIRLANLTALAFDVHLLIDERPGAVSTCEIPAAEVKNDIDLSFDIPPALVRMLIDYRKHLAPKILGFRPDQVFVNADGRPKSKHGVRLLVQTYLMRRAGIAFNPHLFRHLAAMLMLEEEPGAFEIVRQLLGHTRLETTTAFYAGVNTRRAGLHHQKMLERSLARASGPRRPATRPIGAALDH